MTTKDYVKKYNLDKGIKFEHNLFVQDMQSELLSLLELNKALDNLKGFDNALRCLKMKWDAIANKTLGVFPEKLWNYFYATVVVKLRKELCPREVDAKEKIKAARTKQWEERKKWDDDVFENLYEQRSRMWERIWSLNLLLSIKQVPATEFQLLGFKNIENINSDDIRKSYRELSMKHHPDKGGKQELFVQLTEAKNKCLAWLEKN